jgi:5-(carboxyamino)imidazole ribonucleotide synthase
VGGPRKPLLPGSTIGVLGSGQLGRMLALAARPLDLAVHVLSPGKDTPTGQVAAREVTADYLDLDAVRSFAAGVDVVTFEFENVPAACAEAAAELVPVRPAHRVLHIAQHRLREKTFLSGAGFPVAPFETVRGLPDLTAALERIGTPAVLKSAGFGYDGKGQALVEAPEGAEAAWAEVTGHDERVEEAVLEGFVDFEREVSVVAARGQDGAFAHWGVIANDHENHVLDLSVAPAPVPPEVAAEAVRLTRGILEELDVVGVLCVEMFLTGDGSLLVNELAPRPHNSGHLTVDAAVTSQFEQQARAVCGLPLGATDLVSPAAMANLLGDLWADGEPDWAAALAHPGVKLHLYGKKEARPGRKMGHLTVLAPTAEQAAERVLAARRALVTSSRDGSE